MNSTALDLILIPDNREDNRGDNRPDNRLDKLLARAAEQQNLALSRARLQSLIKQGYVRLHGEKMLDPAHKLKHETLAQLTLPPPQAVDVAPVAMDLAIIYEDDDVLVVDKPAGLTTHPGAGNHSHTLVNGLLHHERTNGGLSLVGGVLRPGIVHRLDKDTGGLLVVAKNDAAHHHLAAQFAAHSVGRRYKALVSGVPKPLHGTIDKPIGRHPKDRKRMLSGVRGKHAVTDYRTSEAFGGILSLLECRLHTGRTHQIRAHLADFGHALIGDKVYGKSAGGALARKFTTAALQDVALAEVASAVQKFPRQALHAEFLSFIHPKTGEKLEFHSDLPADFAELLGLCRKIR